MNFKLDDLVIYKGSLPPYYIPGGIGKIVVPDLASNGYVTVDWERYHSGTMMIPIIELIKITEDELVLYALANL